MLREGQGEETKNLKDTNHEGSQCYLAALCPAVPTLDSSLLFFLSIGKGLYLKI